MSGAVSEHQVILVLQHPATSERDQENLVVDAMRISAKLGTKSEARSTAGGLSGECTVFADVNAFKKAWGNIYHLYGVTKLHVIAHGNQQTCGPLSAVELAGVIAGGGAFDAYADFDKVTLHSCMAGSPLNGSLHGGGGVNQSTKNSIYVEQVASALAKLLPANRVMYVRGSDGKSYTDVNGKNWILTDTKDDVLRDPSKPKVEADSFRELLAAKNKIREAKGARYQATATGIG